MPRYISLHTLACLTRQGAEHLTARLAAADRVTMRRVQINMIEGKMLVEFESADRETLDKGVRDEGFHYDWVLRVEFEARGGRPEPAEAPKPAGRAFGSKLDPPGLGRESNPYRIWRVPRRRNP